MRWLARNLVLLLLLVGLAGGGLLLWDRYGKQVRATSSSTVLALQDHAFLVTGALTYRAVHTRNATGLLGPDEEVVTAVATVFYGIDLDALAPTAVLVEAERVTLSLPRLEILAVDVDAQSIEVISRRSLTQRVLGGEGDAELLSRRLGAIEQEAMLTALLYNQERLEALTVERVTRFLELLFPGSIFDVGFVAPVEQEAEELDS